MKKLFWLALVLVCLVSTDVYARVKYIPAYTRKNGTPVRGHYRDVSNDGNPYNNANYLGLNNYW